MVISVPMKWVENHRKLLQSRIQHREKSIKRFQEKDVSKFDSFAKKLCIEEIKHLSHYNDFDRKTIKKIDKI